VPFPAVLTRCDRFSQEKLAPDLSRDIHVFSTFFYSSLRNKPYANSLQCCILNFFLNKPEESYSAMRTWTKTIDIFAKRYIVVPIHEECTVISLVTPVLILVTGFTGSSPSFTVLANYFSQEHHVPLHSPIMPQLQSLLGRITEVL
jgi:hypothetical protein